MPELILMWSAATILAAIALTVATFAVHVAMVAVQEYLNRYRIRGLTRAQIRNVRRFAADLRRANEAITDEETDRA